jgi:hypothetical protein
MQRKNPSLLGSAELPAAKAWEVVARLLVQWLHAPPKGALVAILVGAVFGVGIILTLETMKAAGLWAG